MPDNNTHISGPSKPRPLPPWGIEGAADLPLRGRGAGLALVSEAVQEIISYRPHWMIRKGNMVFLSVILLLLSLTLFIEYPDVVLGNARLVAVNAPKTATANTAGKVISINVTSGSKVEKGQHLAYIESTANHTETLAMNDWVKHGIEQTRNSAFQAFTTAALPSFYNLGLLQAPWQTFVHEWEEAHQFFGSGYYQKKKVALQQDLEFTSRLKGNINQQLSLSRQEQVLQQTEFAAYDSLAKDKLIAPVELNKYKTGLIGKEQTLTQTAAQLISNDIASHNKQKELLDLQKQVLDQQQKLFSALLLLKSETEKWIQQYVVTAPENGTVFFVTPMQVAEQVSSGQELFYIQPAATSYYVQLMAGQSSLGKIKEGQAVRLKVESYPSEEYGFIRGRVAAISGFPNRRDSFFVKVDLQEGLKTSYRKELFFRNNLSAMAEIITDDRKLFDRFFDPLKKIWK